MKKIFLLVFLLILPTISAREHHISLLAVSELENRGMVADLYLEIKPGQGRVFMDTYPLTKVDTQISTRFAKSIACDYLDIDCSQSDFFYTIRSDSMIIGGPSAGSALTLITIAALDDIDIDESISLTGTINSGGLIGPVGGLDNKIRAARENGLNKVLIPKNQRFVTVQNESLDLYALGKEIGIEVVEVATIDDVVFEFTGRRNTESNKEIAVPVSYSQTMKEIASDLCERKESLMNQIQNRSSKLYLQAMNQSDAASDAFEKNNYYSGASFCFGANIKLTNQLLIEQDSPDLRSEIHKHQLRISRFEANLAEIKLQTLTDLQTYEIVKERIIDANDYLLDAVDSTETGNVQIALYQLAYSIERYNSAVSWSAFFGTGKTDLKIDADSVKTSCIAKLSEAEERYQYVQVYLPARIKDTRTQIDRAYEDMESGEYALCLFKASKAKAEADVVLSSLGISEEMFDDYLGTKLGLVKNQIASQSNFPILGYSYYEYANNLKDSDKYSALIYSEYALELSNLELYFRNKEKRHIMINTGYTIAFLLGGLLGLAFGVRYRKQSKKELRIKLKH